MVLVSDHNFPFDMNVMQSQEKLSQIIENIY